MSICGSVCMCVCRVYMREGIYQLQHWQNKGRACWGCSSIEAQLCTDTLVKHKRLKSKALLLLAREFRSFRNESSQSEVHNSKLKCSRKL